MFRRFRLYIKLHFPTLYIRLRNILFPFTLPGHKRALQKFTNRTVYKIKYSKQAFDIILDPRNGFVDETIFVNGVYEPDILDILFKYIKKGDSFVDIGTNIGQHSLFAASIVGAEGQVISFEPISHVAAQFKDSIALNHFGSRITLIQKACGNKEGAAEIHLREGNTGASSISMQSNTESKKERIEICVPDDILLKQTKKVALIKIDVEGYEPLVILGLKRTIERDRPIIILEYSPLIWPENHPGSKQVILSLNDTYTVFDLENGLRIIDDMNSWSTSFTKVQTNLLFIPKMLKS